MPSEGSGIETPVHVTGISTGTGTATGAGTDTGPGEEARPWLTCTVTEAGPSVTGNSTLFLKVNTGQPPIIVIGLTDTAGSFSRQQFSVPGNCQNEMLAVALAAISTGKQVVAQVDTPAAGTLAQCYSLYLQT